MGAWIPHREGEQAVANTGASPGFVESLATCNACSFVSGSTPFPTSVHTPSYTPWFSEPRYPGWFGLSGPVPQIIGMLTLGPSGGVALGNLRGDLFAPTAQECTVPSGPPGFLQRESAQHSLCPVGTRSASPAEGRRLTARACYHTPVPKNPQPEARLFRLGKEATPASPPSLPHSVLPASGPVGM